MKINEDELLKNNYEKYNIPDALFEKIFSSNEDKIKKMVIIENYIIEQVKKENIEIELLVLDKCSFLKTIIKHSKLYFQLIKEISKQENTSVEKIINKLYEDALEKSLDNYNSNKLISENILYNMKKILLEKFNYSTLKVTESFNEKTKEENEINSKKDIKCSKNKSKVRTNLKNDISEKEININFDKAIFELDEVPIARKMINLDYLLNIIEHGKNKKDTAIILLLFGGVEDKYYKTHDIAKALNIDIEYVNNIYIKCLDTYNNYLEEIYKSDIVNNKLGLKM